MEIVLENIVDWLRENNDTKLGNQKWYQVEFKFLDMVSLLFAVR